ncbi:UDP-N-acetylmuramate dehydrogenase [uncultured Senegalimassilia sp.]|uniref:UDP-N-acetylmuramate dehydrogenase n=1 Tax=uncultured Senegalimassilia sp. TaxID=1714350 RepID=UPI0026E067A8|nr:UDP-N-acetylmuramate dehydrogenase [uncultured Senegalimassilia sp.]
MTKIDATLTEALRGIVGPEAVRVGVPMSELTTFRIGGPAAVVVEPATADEAAQVLGACHAAGAEVRVLGLGSDLLVSDAGVDAVVVRLAQRFSDIKVQGTKLFVDAGASNEQVAQAALAAGLAGYEFASGIPGTIGGAAIMNAGAYGGEFRDACCGLTCATPDGRIVQVTAWQACWGYRHSMMGDEGWTVLGAVLQLRPDSAATIRARMDDLAARRAEKQPLDMPSAGSTFKRPAGYFAGKLIQDAGLRGFSVGGAQVSQKHTGFVVNAGGATAADVRELIAQVQQRVFENEGVRLEPEVRMWGFADGQ